MADQDNLAAEWGEALAEQGATPKGGAPVPAAAGGGAERILNQEEIDSLLGFNLADMAGGKRLIIATATFRNEPY